MFYSKLILHSFCRNLNNKIIIDGKTISNFNPPYIIAEISANHNGSLERAFETINSAAKCGVDAIKMQTYIADTMTIDCDKKDFIINGGLWDGFKLYDLYKLAETPYEWHKQIFDYAKNLGITIFSTPFDESAVDLLESLNTPAYKIASFELLDLPLIKYAASTLKPIIISTGMSSDLEISEAVETVLSVGNKNLILLHCISSYPTPPENYNLRRIEYLKKRFGVISGLSDHTMGTTTAIASIPLGSSVIEKHFTISRLDKGPDSEFSSEPSEFYKLCSESKQAWSSLGNQTFNRDVSEVKNKDLRRSIYFIKDKKAGELISESDIKRIRPGRGIHPKYFSKIIGSKLKVDVERGDPTSWELFEY